VTSDTSLLAALDGKKLIFGAGFNSKVTIMYRSNTDDLEPTASATSSAFTPVPASAASAVDAGRCNFCNQPTNQFLPSRNFYLCNTSVECLGKYAVLLRKDVTACITRDGGVQIIPANRPEASAAVQQTSASSDAAAQQAEQQAAPEAAEAAEVAASSDAAAADAAAVAAVATPITLVSKSLNIYRWNQDEETEEEEEEADEADEPVEENVSEMTCVLYQENGQEFRVTRYYKDSIQYLSINGAHVKVDDFKNMIYDITTQPVEEDAYEEDEGREEMSLVYTASLTILIGLVVTLVLYLTAVAIM
jgi:hypothetical protein